MPEATEHGATDLALLQEALGKFESIIEYKTKLFLNVARRTTAAVRFGMAMLLIVALSIMFLLYSLTTRFDQMLGNIVSMNDQFAHIESDMAMVEQMMVDMDLRMAYLGPIHEQFNNINTQMERVVDQVTSIDDELGGVNRHMNDVSSHVQFLTGNVAGMDHAVSGMGNEVRQMSRPMQWFPFQAW